VVNVTQPRWKEQTQRKGIRIELSKNLGKIPKILGNPSELREVMTNIVFNAVDAMPNGGGITITTSIQAEDWVELRIADTGIGMSEEVRRRVFDPFFTTKGVTNTGLGMSVSYGLSSAMEGQSSSKVSPERAQSSSSICQQVIWMKCLMRKWLEPFQSLHWHWRG